MKRVKKKLHLEMNLEAALSRLKAICHVSADQEVAQLFKITPQNFANKKKRGPYILILCITRLTTE
jgi:hypothetical protein